MVYLRSIEKKNPLLIKMVITSIMTSEGEIKSKEGANVSTALTDDMHDAWVLQAESKVNVIMRINFSDLVTAGMNADVKGILSDIVSSMVAMNGIMYDMSGYTSRAEAENMVDVLRDGIQSGWSLIRDKNATQFLQDA